MLVSRRRVRRSGRTRRAARPLLEVLAGDEARVVLVDVELAVEAEVVGVGPQEALDVGLRGQLLELLVLERAQVLAPDLRRLLGLGNSTWRRERASRRLLPISNTARMIAHASWPTRGPARPATTGSG